MDQQVIMRRVRITFSVFCGILCAILVLYWFVSYDSFGHRRMNLATSVQLTLELYRGQSALVLSAPGQQSFDWLLVDYPAQNENKSPGIAGFAFLRSPTGGVFVAIPFWFSVLMAVIAGAAPWLRWTYQFSLRTLLIATTLVAVVLWLGVWLAG